MPIYYKLNRSLSRQPSAEHNRKSWNRISDYLALHGSATEEQLVAMVADHEKGGGQTFVTYCINQLRWLVPDDDNTVEPPHSSIAVREQLHESTTSEDIATEASVSADELVSAPMERSIIEKTLLLPERDPSFRRRVLLAHGVRCSVCSVTSSLLIQAAHIQPVSEGGSDEVNNGIPLCANHHLAFDSGLWAIHPSTQQIIVRSDQSKTALGIEADTISLSLEIDSLAQRYSSFGG